MTDPRPAAGLEAVLADTLAALANASLDLDPVSHARLAALEGCLVQITTEAPPPLGERHFGLTVSGGRLRFYAHALERPHVIVRGTPIDLAMSLFAREGAAGARVVIDGDATMLRQLTAVLRGFRPDPGIPLERLLGRDLAGRALGGVELALATLRSAFDAAGASVRQGAARNFADSRQLEGFADELDELQLRVDRLAARVRAEEQRRAPP
ncbi:MAG: hypothetical protein ACNA7W_11515 [Pseudomonadales bacterium]